MKQNPHVNSDTLSKYHTTAYNVARILKGKTKKVKCHHCGIILYTKRGGKGYSCWHCIKKNNPEYYTKHFKL